MKNLDPSRRNFLRTVAGASAGLALASELRNLAAEESAAAAAPADNKPLETVRLGFIGVGARGSGHVETMMGLPGVEVMAIADNHEPSLKASVDNVKKAGKKEPTAYGNGEYDYKHMLERDDIDAVIICTPWEWHTRMCVDTMNSGKRAFTEVPAAVTLDECWQLVETSEKTGKTCMMMENCCYGREELFCLNLCRQDMFGELLYAEGGYLHDLRGQMHDLPHGTGSWRTWHYIKRNGNLYPTHGLGPLAQCMGINRGDRFDFLTSTSSPAVGRKEYAKANFPTDHQWNKVTKWNCGDMVSTVIKSAQGRTLLVQWNETSPRPYSRISTIQGSHGLFTGYPSRLSIEGVTPGEEFIEGEKLEKFITKYEHPMWKKMGEMAKKNGGHGGMDWLMSWRIIECLHHGEPLDQDVYDAAALSSVGPLSEKSIANRSSSVDFPDFTRGKWKTIKPLPVIG